MARRSLPLVTVAAALFVALAFASGEPQQEEATVATVDGAHDPTFVAPQIILGTQKQPVFPPAAWDARYSGSVILEMTIGKDGAVRDIEVVRCTRPKVGFEEAAVAALREWQFEPGMENGEPVDVKTRLKLNFTRVGIGLQAKPQVSAGSFTVEPHDAGVDASAGFSTGGSDPK